MQSYGETTGRRPAPVALGTLGNFVHGVKAGLEFVPPIVFAAHRYDVAGVLMFASAVTATDETEN